MNELALKECESFLKDFPESKKADQIYFLMGECLRDLGKREAADAAFEKVFNDYPQSALRLKALRLAREAEPAMAAPATKPTSKTKARTAKAPAA